MDRPRPDPRPILFVHYPEYRVSGSVQLGEVATAKLRTAASERSVRISKTIGVRRAGFGKTHGGRVSVGVLC